MTAEGSLCDIIESVTQLVLFYKDRAAYQADCDIQEALDEHRRALYESDSSKMRNDTVELAKCKLKLQLLEAEMEKLPECLVLKLKPIVEKFSTRISGLRKCRRGLVQR